SRARAPLEAPAVSASGGSGRAPAAPPHLASMSALRLTRSERGLTGSVRPVTRSGAVGGPPQDGAAETTRGWATIGPAPSTRLLFRPARVRVRRIGLAAAARSPNGVVTHES